MDYQFTLLCISLLCASCILLLLRKSLLHPLHAVWWMVVALIILLAGVFPHAFDVVGHTLGVTYPPTLYLAIAVVVLLVRMLLADLERCTMMLQQRRMNQHLARLALRVRQLEKADGGLGGSAPRDRENGEAASAAAGTANAAPSAAAGTANAAPSATAGTANAAPSAAAGISHA